MCKETAETKSTFAIVEIIRAEINAGNYSKGPTSVLLKSTPEFILVLAFQEGYCIFSINNPLTPLAFFGLGQAYFILFILYILW